MTILQSDPENILLGKISYVPKWPLNIHMRLVLLKNDEVYDIEEALKYRDLGIYTSVFVTVAHNDKILIQENLKKSMTRTVYIRDDEPGIHNLTMAIVGKTDDHSCLDGETSITIAVEVQVKIDDIPATHALFATDYILLGDVDKKYIAEFQLPIFHHLIQHQGLINKYIST